MPVGMEKEGSSRQVEESSYGSFINKDKDSKNDCNNYRGISLPTVAGKVCSGILTERVIKLKVEKVSEKEGGYRKGRGCAN